ncbi:hypothetical protein IWX91DRAFT_396992 [Phyllosticta citricarpa]
MGYLVVGAAASFLHLAFSLALHAAAPPLSWAFSAALSTIVHHFGVDGAATLGISPADLSVRSQQHSTSDWSAFRINDDPNGLLGRLGCCWLLQLAFSLALLAAAQSLFMRALCRSVDESLLL